jgi:hypothetical protein
MYTYEHSVRGAASLARVWELYSDVSEWSMWDKGVKRVELAGAFVEGSQGIMEMMNGQKLPFTITESTPKRSFSTLSQIGAIRASFGHMLEEANGSVVITHSVTIEGGDEGQMVAMGRGITASIPECLDCLLALAESE